MILKIAIAIALSQAVRSRVDEKNPGSQCLWWPQSPSIELRISQDGNPETPGTTEFDAIRKAMSTWQNQLESCSDLRLVAGPNTPTRKAGYFEDETNENVAIFRLRKCTDIAPMNDACHREADNCGNQFDCWQHVTGAIAITTTSYNPETGRILDSDIEYNSPAFIFSTVDEPPCLSGMANTNCVAADVQNTTTHELGHLLGLSHSASASSTMSFRANPAELNKRVLDADSARFVCDVYPSGRPSRTCFLNSVSSELGARAPGCHTTPGSLLFTLALALLTRRRAP